MENEPARGLKSTTNSSPSSPAATEHSRNYKINNKKRSNKVLCCPFACPTCQSLGHELVKSKYEIVNILSDTGDSIFSPMHEKYHDEVNSLRNTGQVFLSGDLVDSLFSQKFRKLEEI